ncbi:hypothetical protein [Streptomyces hydrogenans]|uniref:hypothetical protein n=1 Tax=Streptomyces hydrogenans TaxID=1873719 RepID=UPI0035D6E3DC
MLPTSAADFYDGPADDHHLIHADRDASVRSQGSAPHAPVGREDAAVLDRACGIGTQALGPAPHGHRATGTDPSPWAAARAAREARARARRRVRPPSTRGTSPSPTAGSTSSSAPTTRYGRPDSPPRPGGPRTRRASSSPLLLTRAPS